MTTPFSAALRLFSSAFGKESLRKAIRFGLLGVCLGGMYTWASPRVHPPNTQFGLGYGMVHGALMPMALPALVMGEDITIYSDRNNGRPYKIGYIIGINVCGLIVFGTIFGKLSGKSSKEIVSPA